MPVGFPGSGSLLRSWLEPPCSSSCRGTTEAPPVTIHDQGLLAHACRRSEARDHAPRRPPRGLSRAAIGSHWHRGARGVRTSRHQAPSSDRRGESTARTRGSPPSVSRPRSSVTGSPNRLAREFGKCCTARGHHTPASARFCLRWRHLESSATDRRHVRSGRHTDIAEERSCRDGSAGRLGGAPL